MRFTDQMGSTIELKGIPSRIVSLVPSQSEFLWDLGLKNQLVGVTRFCVHPSELKKQSAIVGGTKKLNISKILELRPDLIIGNKEENDFSQIAELQKHAPVWMSDIITLDDAYWMMKQVGALVNKEPEAETIVSGVRAAIDSVARRFSSQRVAYFIWKKPYMLAGGNTFIDSILRHIGLINVAAGLSRYPEVTPETLRELNPQYLFLSSEPYPFKEVDVREMEKFFPGSRALIVDGEAFSWYGSRLLRVPALLPRI